jgi:hypothetical protein
MQVNRLAAPLVGAATKRRCSQRERRFRAILAWRLFTTEVGGGGWGWGWGWGWSMVNARKDSCSLARGTTGNQQGLPPATQRASPATKHDRPTSRLQPIDAPPAGCSSGRDSTAAPGTRRRAPRRQRAATWQCCSGRGSMAAPGTRGRAAGQRLAATWQCCSGRGSTAAPGTRARAARRQRAATWQCCSGRGSTAAPGTRRRAAQRQRAATWQCCSGRGSTAAPGIQMLAGLGPLMVQCWLGSMRSHDMPG